MTMPRGPKGEKRPADVIGNAVEVMRIATGEEVEEMPNDGKDPEAKALGKKGGVARAKSTTPERRIRDRADLIKSKLDRARAPLRRPAMVFHLFTNGAARVGALEAAGRAILRQSPDLGAAGGL